MSTISEIYMPEIRRVGEDLQAHEKEWAAWRDASNRYQRELSEVTRELRRKHDMDEVERKLQAERAEIGRIEGRLLKARCRLVAGTADLLFHADPDAVAGTVEAMGGKFKVEFSGADGSGFLGRYHVLSESIRDDGWWDLETREFQENGIIWLCDRSNGAGIGIPVELFRDGLYSFLAWSDGRLAALAGSWTDKWLEANRMDREKRRALYEALAKEFGD